jgi:adenylate cyclase
LSNSFLSELKRRNVFRVIVAYLVLSWLVLQVVDVFSELLALPEVFAKVIFAALIIGFIIAVIISWVYELTPEGLQKDSGSGIQTQESKHVGKKLDIATIAMVIIGIAFIAFYEKPPTSLPVDDTNLNEQSNNLAAKQSNSKPSTQHNNSINSRSIAVLPFVNMSADPENEYFADGLSEELLNQLAQIHDLKVAGRTSSFSYKGKNEDLRTIGNTLGVANILEGSVRRSANKVRVTAQLIRVSDGFHLWSKTYDETMDDVFVIQDNISVNVAETLKIVLDKDSLIRMQRAGIRNVDAFVAFQKGRELFMRAHGSEPLIPTLEQGLVYFKKAIELVPDFASAYWQMADYYAHIILTPNIEAQTRQKALDDLRETLTKAKEYSQGNTMDPFIEVDQVLLSDDWTPLRNRLQNAFDAEGCPSPTWIESVMSLGYAKQSIEMWNRYQECEPLSISAPLEIAFANNHLGNFEEAKKQILKGYELHGANVWYDLTLQRIYLGLGKPEKALELAESISKDVDFGGMSGYAAPYAYMQEKQKALDAIEAWKAQYGENKAEEMLMQAILGNRDEANALAAIVDARPAGAFELMVYTNACLCGAPFDLKAAPNLAQRIKESKLQWPPTHTINYPLKDW